DLNVEDKFMATADLLQQTGYPRLLFIIDELDRVADTAGLANFLKNASSATTKFLLVGIGHSITSLLSDHESIVRSLVPVTLWRQTPSRNTSLMFTIKRCRDQSIARSSYVSWPSGR